MYQIIKIEPQLAKEAKAILEDVGIDLETVVKMTLKRVVKEGNISFLMAMSNPSATENSANTISKMESVEESRMSKNLAISLFTAQGIRFNRNVTYASKNKTAYNYWANPYFFALNKDWFLILNDWMKRELHLFMIPANSIHPNRMVARNDMVDKIDLQISYNDPTFTDSRSKISFSRFLVKSIRY